MDVEVFIEAVRTCGMEKAVADVVAARANALKDEYDRIVERKRVAGRKSKAVPTAEAATEEAA